eukprot:3073375-Pleurochrysis_carterae.AAC.1
MNVIRAAAIDNETDVSAASVHSANMTVAKTRSSSQCGPLVRSVRGSSSCLQRSRQEKVQGAAAATEFACSRRCLSCTHRASARRLREYGCRVAQDHTRSLSCSSMRDGSHAGCVRGASLRPSCTCGNRVQHRVRALTCGPGGGPKTCWL